MTTPPVPSITDEQLAELERAALAKKSEGFLLVHNLSCNDMLALIARLRAAERDAARYQWIRNYDDDDAVERALINPNYTPAQIRMGDRLDSAIDTAMDRPDA